MRCFKSFARSRRSVHWLCSLFTIYQCKGCLHIVPGRPAVKLLSTSSNGASHSNGASNGSASKGSNNGHAKDLPSLRIGIVLSGGQAPGTHTLRTLWYVVLNPYGICSSCKVPLQAGIMSLEACWTTSWSGIQVVSSSASRMALAASLRSLSWPSLKTSWSVS